MSREARLGLSLVRHAHDITQFDYSAKVKSNKQREHLKKTCLKDQIDMVVLVFRRFSGSLSAAGCAACRQPRFAAGALQETAEKAVSLMTLPYMKPEYGSQIVRFSLWGDPQNGPPSCGNSHFVVQH